MRILILEDDPGISRFLVEGLTEEGHIVGVVDDLARAREALAAGHFDLLLVDRMLPDGDGLALVREVRETGSSVPVLVLTALDGIDDRVDGLRDGADDYLVKPFAFAELLARIDALARRSGLGSRLQVADLVVDTERRQARRGGEVLALTRLEFDLLAELAAHAGRVVTRAELLTRVWQLRHDPGTKVVEVTISHLRGKVDRSFPVSLIQTVRGVGYLLGEAPR